MVFIILPVKGDEGLTHTKLDEVQTKVDCFLGLSGECSRKVSHRFLNRRYYAFLEDSTMTVCSLEAYTIGHPA